MLDFLKYVGFIIACLILFDIIYMLLIITTSIIKTSLKEIKHAKRKNK